MNQQIIPTRRQFLRGAGLAVALPWLESIGGPWANAATAKTKTPELPLRMAFVYVPNGMHMPHWTPEKEGALTDLPRTLKPLENLKSEFSILSGLALDGGRGHRDGPGDHARALASFLTGAHPLKTAGKDIRAGVSADQEAAAQALSSQASYKPRFASLELGLDESAQAGNCDSGYSCAYSSNISWRTPNSPLAKETNPRAVFDRLMGSAGGSGPQSEVARRQQMQRSILDFVSEDAQSLERRLGSSDRRKLDEYLYAVRDIERRVDKAVPFDSAKLPAGIVRPYGKPHDFAEHASLMLDMMVLAFQTDSTRIITLVYANEGSTRPYPEIGIKSGHHELSHHQHNAEKQAGISKINHFHVSLFARFLERLHSIRENGSTLLDRSMIVYGSGIGDGDRHNHDDLPILLAGRGAGTIRPGRHIRYPFDTPLTNLYVGMLRRMGVPADKFSDSTGELKGLV
jgi:hypothetical protein